MRRFLRPSVFTVSRPSSFLTSTASFTHSQFHHASPNSNRSTVGSVRFASTTPEVADTNIAETPSVEAVEGVADAAFVLSEEEPWRIIKYSMEGINYIHDLSGLPWWGSIIATTLFLRFLMFPVALKTFRSTGAMAIAKPALDAMNAEMNKQKEQQGGKLTQEENMYYNMKYRDICKENGFSMGSMMLMPLIQAPVFITLFATLRQFGDYYDITQGGTAWFTNLAVQDPTYALPIIACGVSLLAMETGGETGGNQQPGQNKMKMFMRVMLVGFLPITAQFPACLFM